MKQAIRQLGIFPSVLLGIGLFLTGIMALNYMVNNLWPFDVARLDLVRATALDRVDAASLLEAANPEIIWAFLATVFMSVMGLMLPLAFFLNKRFGSHQNPPFMTTLRQATWLGLWVAFCVWLQMNRTLGLAVATLVAAILVMFEILLQVRTRAANV